MVSLTTPPSPPRSWPGRRASRRWKRRAQKTANRAGSRPVSGRERERPRKDLTHRKEQNPGWERMTAFRSWAGNHDGGECRQLPRRGSFLDLSEAAGSTSLHFIQFAKSVTQSRRRRYYLGN